MGKVLTLMDIKKKILNNYWEGSLTGHDIDRPMFILKLKDNYAECNTYIISIQGSPPKGRAIITSDYHNSAYMVMIGNRSKVSKRMKIDFTFEDKKEARAIIIDFDETTSTFPKPSELPKTLYTEMDKTTDKQMLKIAFEEEDDIAKQRELDEESEFDDFLDGVEVE